MYDSLYIYTYEPSATLSPLFLHNKRQQALAAALSLLFDTTILPPHDYNALLITVYHYLLLLITIIYYKIQYHPWRVFKTPHRKKKED